ncbi:hypothetical protein JCM11251_002041 [Rhodosporidiobolus azoricus]
MFDSPAPFTAERLPSPPLSAWSSLPSGSSPSSTPLTSFDTPSNDSGAFTPAVTASTAFTTPDLAGSGWEKEVKLQRIGDAPSTFPVGFDQLDTEYIRESKEEKPRSFEWEVYADSSDSTATPKLFKRRLGPTEVSYYLGSRGEGVEGGVNDMYLHLGFKARSHLMQPDRILDVWTEIVSRHAFLGARVEFKDYYDVHFCYEPHKTPSEARIKAASLLDLRTNQDGKALLDLYLNGPRTLSDERLAYLVISTPEMTFTPDDPTSEEEYDFFLFSTHFLGDGMALHGTANEFFSLLADSPSPESGIEARNIEARNIEAIKAARGEVAPSAAILQPSTSFLPPAMESKLLSSATWGKFGWTGARVDFARDQGALIGGHSFPRARLGTRQTLVPTVSFDSTKTKRILAACKAHGVTIAHAAFALSNAAYIRSVAKVEGEDRRKPQLPVMIYSALNVRPYLEKSEADWYHIAIGYYNIILPSFLPSTLTPSAYFWHQALSVRRQTSKVVKTPLLAARTALMALERERRSIGWERADEEKRKREREVQELEGSLQGLGIGLEKEEEGEEAKRVKEAERLAQEEKETAAKTFAEKKEGREALSKAPSNALLGLSMLGNLDGMYKHGDYHGIQLHTLTTGSRQRPGALLLFAYTFAGKLWFSLGYDANGFADRSVEKWWDELLKGVDEFLLEEPTPIVA